MKTIEEVTLYDLMAEDLDVWVTANSKFGFDLQIEGDDGVMVEAEGIHPFAADSFADFCRRYLASYDKAELKEVAA